MKIISQGIRPEDRVCQGRCNGCRNVDEYTVGEARVQTDQREGNFYVVKCPTCQGDVYGELLPLPPTGVFRPGVG